MAIGRSVKTAIQMKHFGDLAAVVAKLPEKGGGKIEIGRVIGRCNGVTFRASVSGEAPSLGLVGQFRARSTIEPDAAELVAPVIYLPNHFCELVKAELLAGREKEMPKKAPAKGKGLTLIGEAEIELQLSISVERNDGGGVPYKFDVAEVNKKIDADDPLAHLAGFLGAEGKPALPAPDTGKAKGKGKRK